MPQYKVFIPIYRQIITAKDEEEAIQTFNENCDCQDIEDGNVQCEELPDINTADHPCRKAAIAVIERIIEPLTKKEINGEKYYELEDELTELIAQYK